MARMSQDELLALWEREFRQPRDEFWKRVIALPVDHQVQVATMALADIIGGMQGIYARFPEDPKCREVASMPSSHFAIKFIHAIWPPKRDMKVVPEAPK